MKPRTACASIGGKVEQLQEVGDFEAQNCLPILNLTRSTKPRLSTKRKFLVGAVSGSCFSCHEGQSVYVCSQGY